MDTFFKVLSGILLGVIICFAWDFKETHEAAKKGLKPGWVPIKPLAPPPKPAPKPAAPRIATSPAPAPRQQPPALPRTQRPAPSPRQAPMTSVAFAKLAGEPWRWPARTQLTVNMDIPLMEANVKVGIIPLKAGTEVSVFRILSNGQVHARAQGQVFAIRAENTDIARRILPEGTPRPPPRPRPVLPQPSTRSSPAKSSPRPASSRQTPKSAPVEEPPASGGGSLFGVPIQ